MDMEDLILRQTVAQENIAKEIARFNRNIEEITKLVKQISPMISQMAPLLAMMNQEEK